MTEDTFQIVFNPAWRPFTDADVPGFVILAIFAAILVGLTFFTYFGNPQTTGKRLTILILLRLLALFLAILTALRPSLAITENPKIPSTLIIVVDHSESMTVKDEFNDYSRWEVVQRAMAKCQPLFEQLQSDQAVTIHLYRFAKDFDPNNDKYDSSVIPDGKRTDFGTMLQKLYDQHQAERNLRGLILVSDGRNNGPSIDPMAEITKWKGIGCPVYTFGVGQSNTRSDQKDLAFRSIAADPSPVPIKSDLTIKGVIDALGFEGARVDIQLLIDDKPFELPKSFDLPKASGNDIEFKLKAPEKPGEYKITLKIVKGPVGEVSQANNSIDTYLTVTKEGVRVLVIDRLREELSYLRSALASDKRFDYVEVVRQTDAPLPQSEAKKFDLKSEAYDVIILGDVSARSLNSIDPNFMRDIANAVTDKGLGLIMIGGVDSFGGTPGNANSGDWLGSPIAEVLPVKDLKPAAQIQEPIQLLLTEEGKSQYVTKLDADGAKNASLWNRLNQPRTQLDGFTIIGERKQGSIVFLKAQRKGQTPENAAPLLVGQDVGKGRTVAFGADTTGRKWRRLGIDNPKNPREGLDLHARFWKQMVLWAAHQDELEGNVWIRPELRRMAVNGRQVISMGIRDKRGDEITNGNLTYQVVTPGENPDRSKARKPERDAKGQFRANYEPKAPGEYRIYAWGEGKDSSGAEVKGDAFARFIVYPEISDEMLQIAANPKFLLDLENAANGTSLDTLRKANQLPDFLTQLRNNPLKPTSLKQKLIPDWSRDRKPTESNPNARRSTMPWFLPLLLVMFFTVLGVEWGLRRLWGMV